MMLARHSPSMRRLILFLLVAGLAFAGFGFWTAVQDPQVVRYRLAMPGLAAPLRIVQLSDSHVGSIDMPASRLDRVVAQMNALKPDLVLLTGDYVSGDPDKWSMAQTRAALEPFKALQAPLGVFAVLGNHDDPAKTAKVLAGSPVRLLVGMRAEAGPLQIVGADDIARGSPAVEQMRATIRAAPRDKPMIVAAHRPSMIQWLPPRPSVLMVAGHTHGGQFKLPIIGAWAIDEFYATHQRGIFSEGPHRMLVSSGLGTTNLPLRIGVPPEIVELTLVPATAGDVSKALPATAGDVSKALPATAGNASKASPTQPGRNSGTDR
jgi:predicted MPP superfamily phosphohydrolase